MSGKRKYEPKDPSGLTDAVVVWLWFVAIAIICEFVALLVQTPAIARLDPQLDVTTASPQRVALFGALIGRLDLIKLAIVLIAAVIALKWIYRTDANAHAMAKGLTISPPWAVGFFFVPLLGLIRPYQALREIWRASARPQGGRGLSDPAVLRGWWGLFLAGDVAGCGGAILGSGRTAESLLMRYASIAVMDVLHLAACLLFVFIVREVGARQAAALAAHAMSPGEDELAPAWRP